ncbi:MAG TPA: DUF5076 domain-containing protein [Terriglobales bacterium]|nr:DUF5076 domain-containing protein [Terriglobales bacterium]
MWRDKRQLSIPEAAEKDSQAIEILRVWRTREQQYVSLRAGVWDDPAAWGILLVDIARHVTNSYEQTKGLDPIETLERIKTVWGAEMESPTDTPSGQVRDDGL